MTTTRRARFLRVTLVSAAAGLGCTAPVAVDLSDEEAEAGRRALAESGIASEHVATANGRAQLRVPLLDADRALAKLSLRAPRSAEPPADPPLVPSRARAELDADRLRAQDVEAALERLPGVAEAKLVLGPEPRTSILVPGEPPLRSAAVVVTRREGSALDPRAIKAIIANGVGRLAPDSIEIVETRAKTAAVPPALASWGPVSVPETALPTLRLLFGASAFLNLVTLAAVFYFRKRAARGGSQA